MALPMSGGSFTIVNGSGSTTVNPSGGNITFNTGTTSAAGSGGGGGAAGLYLSGTLGGIIYSGISPTYSNHNMSPTVQFVVQQIQQWSYSGQKIDCVKVSQDIYQALMSYIGGTSQVYYSVNFPNSPNFFYMGISVVMEHTYPSSCFNIIIPEIRTPWQEIQRKLRNANNTEFAGYLTSDPCDEWVMID